METAEKCSKCAEDLDTEGTPKWCKACRAKYQREYNATKEGKAEAHGFAAGVTAMRGFLAGEFERLGSSSFDGYEIGNIIRNATTPRPD